MLDIDSVVVKDVVDAQKDSEKVDDDGKDYFDYGATGDVLKEKKKAFFDMLEFYYSVFYYHS